MSTNIFFNHVSSWIDSYYNADSMEWLRRFIDNSQQPDDIKSKLQGLVDKRQAVIKGTPYFKPFDGKSILMDTALKNTDHPKLFTSRYRALCEVTKLRLAGYDAAVDDNKTFFRVKLLSASTINIIEPINN